MNRHFNAQLNTMAIIIHPGEFYSTGDDVAIGTVLGSCVTVTLFDPLNKHGGMNHFMLPGNVEKAELLASQNARYGLYAMELLVNDLLKMGSRKENLVAKVFGGGSVLSFPDGQRNHIPQSNVDLAFAFLEMEEIPIASSDVGGSKARKVFFFPRTNRVLVKKFGGQHLTEVEREEESYLENIARTSRKEKPIIFG